MNVGMCLAGLLTEPLAPTAGAVRPALDASGAGGFEELSVWAWYLPLMTEAGTLQAAREELDRRGLRVRAVEAASAWATGTPDEAAAEVAQMVTAARATGASLILACCLEPTLPDVAAARRNLTALAEQAGDAGADVCVEFLPWTGIPNLAAVWDVVKPLPRVRLVLDTWHWIRQPGGGDLDLLGSLPGDRIAYIQLSDHAGRAVGRPDGRDHEPPAAPR